MINTEPTIITIKSNGKTVTAELPWDVTMPDLAQAIKGLLVANDWGYKLVDEYIKTDDLSDWNVTLNDGLEDETKTNTK